MYCLTFNEETRPLPSNCKITVGRSRGNDILCADTQASRIHGEFKTERGQLSYRDLESTNGSRILGRLLSPNKWEILSDGQSVEIGEWTATVSKTETKPLDSPTPAQEAPIQRPTVDPSGPKEAFEVTGRIVVNQNDGES